MKRLYLRMWIIPLALSMVMLYSCGSNAGEEASEALIEASTGQKVEIDKKGDKIEIEMEGTKSVIDEGQHSWPSNIPNIVPELGAGEIERVTTTTGPDYKGWSIYYQGVDASALDSYDKALKKAGFETMTVKLGEGGTVSGEKGNIIVSCIFNNEGMFLVSVQERSN
jgi:hypothetical protein